MLSCSRSLPSTGPSSRPLGSPPGASARCCTLSGRTSTLIAWSYLRRSPRKRCALGKIPKEIPLHPKLQEELGLWRTKWPQTFGRAVEGSDYLFPSQRDLTRSVTRVSADRALRAATSKLGFNGVSTHSFRRSALTAASDAGIPVRHIMELSGHQSMSVLQAYLSCTAQQKRAVAMAFG